MKYALVGYGRMGRAIESIATQRGHARCAAIDVSAGGAAIAPTVEALQGAEVAFEFTVGPAAEANVVSLLEAGVAVVCGTTGWIGSARLERAVRESGAGLIVAPNFSIGVHLFYRAIAEAGRLIGAAGLHQPYILERHHGGKRDRPSGTAIRLAELLVGVDPRLDSWSTAAVEPSASVLEVRSVRAGAEPGMHEIGFDGEHDRITLSHAARDRGGFALGAVVAAEWLIGRKGQHGFDEVVEDRLHTGGFQ